MSSDNQFVLGLLEGLYKGGVGNSEVNDSRAQRDQEMRQKQAELDLKARESGMVPAGNQPDAGTTGNPGDSGQFGHPDKHSAAASAMSLLFPRSSQGTLNTAYKQDPTLMASKTGYQDPSTGDITGTQQPGSKPVIYKNPEDLSKELAMTGERRSKRDDLDNQKQVREDDSYRSFLMKVNDDMDKAWTSRFSNAGRVQGRQTNAEAVLQLLNQTGGNPDKRQSVELANSINNLISTGSGGSERTLFEMVPQSLVGDVNKVVEWWTNNPRGLEQQAFAKRLGDTAVREKTLAEDQIKEWKSGILAPLKSKLHPDDYKQLLATHDIPIDQINPLTGKYKRKIDPQKTFQDSNSGGGLTSDEMAEFKRLDAKYGKK